MTAELKTHWKKYFNYDYLGTDSLPNGEDLILTIKKLVEEKVTGTGGKKEDCLVCYFQEDVKPMILNRTNSKAIQKIYKTPYIEEWVGLKIQLYAKSGIQAFGTVTDGLRIRDWEPKIDTLAALKTQVREKLESYKGDDKDTIREMLTAKQTNGELTETFLNEILKQLA